MDPSSFKTPVRFSQKSYEISFLKKEGREVAFASNGSADSGLSSGGGGGGGPRGCEGGGCPLLG